MRISDWSSDVCSSDLFAIFSQFQWNLQPCPLCIFQRIAFAALALVLLVAGLHAPKGATGRRVYGVLALVPALAGIAIAARHVWLTHLPAEIGRATCRERVCEYV